MIRHWYLQSALLKCLPINLDLKCVNKISIHTSMFNSNRASLRMR